MAADLLLIVRAGAVILWAVGSDDESDLATSRDDSEIDQSPGQPYAPADPEPYDSQQIIEAISQGDAETAASLAAPDTPQTPWGALEIPLDSAIEWMQASERDHVRSGEVFLGTDSVAGTVSSLCTVSITNGWTEALGLDSMENEIRVECDEDGRVTLALGARRRHLIEVVELRRVEDRLGAASAR